MFGHHLACTLAIADDLTRGSVSSAVEQRVFNFPQSQLASQSARQLEEEESPS